ncbi:TraR/DksA C4-type zinc finger protein [Pseudoalteromonas ulvae]|uniref:Uncharacterized protein n=1 Tax=Pseudoalteromonas ulvae TaxID=107327 RepID=A0A244CUG0_PSEDV|nr:TraR/DksA C4-type zinc finger protein [Pseudoalteromonas ulvae]OUL59238.1 hypothetical protein B1199_02935 [Pseudoalteromonas ulvae]
MADNADRSQIEIERALERSLANCAVDDVVPSAECVECGEAVEAGRAKVLKTNVCAACAHKKERLAKLFAGRR